MGIVSLKQWDEFEKEVISKQRPFYVYGAGETGRKIIRFTGDNVLAVVDKRAREITTSFMHKLLLPEEFASTVEAGGALLNCLNPCVNYLTRTEGVQADLERLLPDKQEIYLYCMDWQNIEKTGVTHWGEKVLLIDNLTCLCGCDLPHMKAAYRSVERFSKTYLKKLYEEPVEFVPYKDCIGLPDFDNGLITHINGRKKTLKNRESQLYQHRIWIFGDSRVSGMLLENGSTFATFLQKKLDTEQSNYEVVNCGIPGRDIERMVYQIQTENLCAGDYVFLCTGFYEYDGSVLENALAWGAYIKDAYDRCRKCGTEFVYINLPTIIEMGHLSSLEKEMLELFTTTEFTDYTYEKVRYYNGLIQCMCAKQAIPFYDFADCFNARHQYGQVFINLHHYGPDGSRLIADKLYQIFKELQVLFGSAKEVQGAKVLKDARTATFQTKLSRMQDSKKQIHTYCQTIIAQIPHKNGKVGAIVMNANPFTNGHLYLVKEAWKRVEFLIVFVVSEDASFFTFEERFQLVQENLRDFDNILIVPSGEFCISKSTFPEYFKKEDIQNEYIDPRKDLTIFAKQIAPSLGISVRFVGEELQDRITRQYNEAMKKLLPQNHIEVIEIPRMEWSGNIISASSVRAHIKEKRLDEIKDIVPRVTFNFISERLDQLSSEDRLNFERRSR